MHGGAELVEVWRGGQLECTHAAHAVIARADGAIVEAWGRPETVIYPRSSAKMIQALPLVESGAADAASLGTEHLALACASHRGGQIHTARVAAWLGHLGLGEADLRCGAHLPGNDAARVDLIKSDTSPCQIHNNCSGKHSGFLTLTQHLGAGPDYIDAGHPVQLAVREAFEEVTGAPSPGYGIDGCSAPNFSARLDHLATAMARYATATEGSARGRAQRRLTQAMMQHPELVADEGAACTELMRAAKGRAAIKGGAEGVYFAILPDLGLGVALKVADGASRASEALIAGLLARLGIIDRSDPAYLARAEAPLVNCRGIRAAEIRLSAALA